MLAFYFNSPKIFLETHLLALFVEFFETLAKNIFCCYYINMKIRSARYLTSVVEKGKLLSDGVCEFAFVGRSNVGKSSLINNLCGVKGLAKTSSSPGATKMINYFDINSGEARFVDLPGYGFHKAGKKNQKLWAGLIEDYLTSSQNLKLVLFLLDIRHKPTELDHIMLQFLIEMKRNFIVIATKADKLSKGAQHNTVESLAKAFGISKQIIFTHSSLNSQGKAEILEYLG